MRDVDAHVATAVGLMRALPAGQFPLSEALGLVVAHDVLAAHDSPPFANSAMDGFALRRADTAGASNALPVTLTLVGEAAAGAPWDVALQAGQAVRIMTGAPIPHGADAVVPIELARERGDVVELSAEPSVRAHIRGAGEDMRAGDVVVSAGTRLGATHLAAAASTGHATVPVRRAPRVAVLATGDELVDPGTPLGPGQIADSNTILLAGLVRQAGAIPVVLPRAPDRPAALLETLAGVDADLIVTVGGVSAGAYDVVKAALAPAGVEFGPVAMQPGKPQGLGVLMGVPIACLPGNPVSALVSFAVIVEPMLRALVGATTPVQRTATVAQGWSSPAGRRQYLPAHLLSDGSVEPVTARGSQSNLVASLARATVLAVVPEAVTVVSVGDTVEIMELNR